MKYWNIYGLSMLLRRWWFNGKPWRVCMRSKHICWRPHGSNIESGCLLTGWRIQIVDAIVIASGMPGVNIARLCIVIWICLEKNMTFKNTLFGGYCDPACGWYLVRMRFSRWINSNLLSRFWTVWAALNPLLMNCCVCDGIFWRQKGLLPQWSFIDRA